MAKKKVKRRAKTNLLGMKGKIPIMATAGAVVAGTRLYDAFKQSGVNGVLYHGTGFDPGTGAFHWQAAWNNWKEPVLMSVASYGAQKLGASRITSKIPIFGKIFRV